jgi:molecular chaperone GrpE
MSLSHEDKVKKSKTPHRQEAAHEVKAPSAEVTELQAALKEKSREAEEHYERLLRLAAEMENLKKRQEKDRAELLQFANESLIKELLPVVDNLELALNHGRQLKTPAPLLEGLELVHQGFLKALEKFGVTPVVSVGQAFDPVFHNAVMQEETREVPDCTILKELQKGYLYRNRLLRPAMVVVARNSNQSAGENVSSLQEEKING